MSLYLCCCSYPDHPASCATCATLASSSSTATDRAVVDGASHVSLESISTCRH